MYLNAKNYLHTTQIFSLYTYLMSFSKKSIILTNADSVFIVDQSEKSIVHKKIPRLVPMVLYPHGIAPTFLKMDSWTLGADFIPIISTKGIN